MDQGLDTGDIILQSYISLNGKLDDIFKNIELIGIRDINKIITDYKNNQIVTYKQDDSKSTFYKRRNESESEINIEEILNNEPVYLYNKMSEVICEFCNSVLSSKYILKVHLVNNKACLSIRNMDFKTKHLCKGCNNYYTCAQKLSVHHDI